MLKKEPALQRPVWKTHRPDPWHCERVQGDAEHDDVKEDDEEDVVGPEPAAVHVEGVGVLALVATSQHVNQPQVMKVSSG